MASDRRVEQLNILLKEELSGIVDREIEFPEKTLATITRVEISPDKHYAAVLVSLLGKQPKEALEILQKNVYNIQKLLNRRLRIRPVPKISFELDKEELKRERIEKSLAYLKKKGEI